MFTMHALYAILHLIENKYIIINHFQYLSSFSKSTLFALFYKLQFLTLFISYTKFYLRNVLFFFKKKNNICTDTYQKIHIATFSSAPSRRVLLLFKPPNKLLQNVFSNIFLMHILLKN